MIVSADPTEDPDGFLSVDGGVRRARDLDDHDVAAGDDPVAWTTAVCETGRAAAGRAR